MRRLFAVLVLLQGCGSGASCGNSQNAGDLCDQAYGVGPDFTALECAPGAICLPSNVAPCAGNDCCHSFCSYEVCPAASPCIDLDPTLFPDGGFILSTIDLPDGGSAVVDGCACPDAGNGPDCLDGGCRCFDGGAMLTSCLQVCSGSSVPL